MPLFTGLIPWFSQHVHMQRRKIELVQQVEEWLKLQTLVTIGPPSRHHPMLLLKDV